MEHIANVSYCIYVQKLRMNYLNNLYSTKITNKLTALHYSFVTFIRNN